MKYKKIIQFPLILFILLIICTGLFLITPKTIYAATEFTSIIDPDNGTGTDYTSLNAWEAANQVDLTATSTLVFSHSGITGTIPDGSTVTGATSGATGTVTHATDTQILIYNITGTFQSGEQVYETLDTNYVTISDAGDSAIAVASCRSSNGSADTTAVAIDGWTTSATNYIKVWTDPSLGNRHNGKWDERKYRISSDADWFTAINVQEEYTIIDGLQFHSLADDYPTVQLGADDGSVNNLILSNSIVKRNNLGDGIRISGGNSHKIYNNVIYSDNTSSSGMNCYWSSADFIYNNTVVGFNNGYYKSAGATTDILENNIAYNNTTDYSGTFDASSDYNISSDDTAPGANSKINQTVNFISTTSGIEDFHLAQSDTSARDAGTDLSSDANLAFSTDIDGTTRTGSWDIGADEGSVEFTPTVMESGGDYSSLFAWEAGVQTDLTASTTRVFSHGGITGTIADDATVTGATSGATATVVHATNTQILLENISGTFQSGEQVQVDASNYVTISDNGNPAIAVAKIDGTWTNPDTTPVTIDGWTTDHDNYIKIYTTDTARHRGVAGTGYYLQTTGQFRVYEDYVRIDGVELYQANNNTLGIYFLSSGETNSDIRVSNCLIHGFTYAIYGLNVATHKIWNNIIYNNTNYGIELGATGSANYIYNNTIFGGTRGIDCTSGTRYIYNNIVQNTSGVAYNIGIGGITGNNISSDATSPDGASFQNLIVPFISTISSSEDFHLASYDTVAKDAGTNLSTDSYLPFSTDIDGNSRPIGSGWDIGADEYNATESVKMRGSVKLRGHFKFR